MRTTSDGGPLILLVHDVEETRDGIEKLLKVDGYRVDSARYEDDAVATALRRSPNLILVNLGGPPTEVIAAARRIREDAQLSEDVPVVIFCIASVNEGKEIDLDRNIYATRPDKLQSVEKLSAPVFSTRKDHPIFGSILPEQTVNFLFDDPVTFANRGFQAFAIKDFDVAP